MRYLPVLLACVACQAPAQPRAWLGLLPPAAGADATPAPMAVEVDVGSIVPGPLGPQAALRVTAPASGWTHGHGYRYRSFVAVVRLDCTDGAVTPIAVTYFEGERGAGAQAGSDGDGTRAGIDPGVLSVVPAQARQALRRATCPQA